jgi:hypothetical protein
MLMLPPPSGLRHLDLLLRNPRPKPTLTVVSRLCQHSRRPAPPHVSPNLSLLVPSRSEDRGRSHVSIFYLPTAPLLFFNYLPQRLSLLTNVYETDDKLYTIALLMAACFFIIMTILPMFSARQQKLNNGAAANTSNTYPYPGGAAISLSPTGIP